VYDVVCFSGMDSGRLSAGHQLAVSPGGYVGYMRTESFSSVGGEFEPVSNSYLPLVRAVKRKSVITACRLCDW